MEFTGDVELKQPVIIIDNFPFRIVSRDIKYLLSLILLSMCGVASAYISVLVLIKLDNRLLPVLLFFSLLKLSEIGYNVILSKKITLVYYPEEELLKFKLGHDKQILPIRALKEVSGRNPNIVSSMMVQYTAEILIDEKRYVLSTNSLKAKKILKELESFCFRMHHRKWQRQLV